MNRQPDCLLQLHPHMMRFFTITWIIASLLITLGCLLVGLFWWAGLAFLILNAFIFYPTLYPYSRLFGPVITRFHTNKREVWLTIDDGPESPQDGQILELLDRYQARATFFVVGEKVMQHKALIRKYITSGHTVENHTMTHLEKSFWRFGAQRIKQEVDECSAVISETCGLRPRYFRSPAGMKNPFVHHILRKRKLDLVCWSARGLDGVCNDVDKVMARLKKQIKPGAIILVHTGRGCSVEILSCLLDYLQSNDYSCMVPAHKNLV